MTGVEIVGLTSALNEVQTLSPQAVKLWLRILFLNKDDINYRNLLAEICNSRNLMNFLSKLNNNVVYEGLWAILSFDENHFSLGKFYKLYSFIDKLSNYFDSRTIRLRQ